MKVACARGKSYQHILGKNRIRQASFKLGKHLFKIYAVRTTLYGAVILKILRPQVCIRLVA